MRYTLVKAFENHLESSCPSNFLSLYCVISKDPAERSWILQEIKKKMRLSSCITYRSGDEKKMLFQMDSLSFFSEKQLYYLSELEKLSKEGQSTLEKKFSSLPKTMVLVLGASSFSKQSSLYKSIEKHGIILDLSEEKLWEKEKNLAEWLEGQARKEKKLVSSDVINCLVKGSQGSFALLATEWDKLLTYTANTTKITMQDLNAICCLSFQDSDWAFGEALLCRDLKKSFEISHRLIDLEISFFSILRQVRYQFMTALSLAFASQEGEKEWIIQKFPYLKGAMLEKQMQVAISFGNEKLLKAIQIIDDLEFKAKDSCDDLKTLYTLLCTRITS